MPATRPSVRLRPVTDADAPEVLALNEREVRHLAPMDPDRMGCLREWADRMEVVEVDGRFAGFWIGLAPGSGYDSPNYRWYSERFGDRFYYLDRIVLDGSVRRQGVGTRVYDELERHAAAYDRLALEVNLEPPNPGSLAFHVQRGYDEVGRLRLDDDHEVVLMAKELQ